MEAASNKRAVAPAVNARLTARRRDRLVGRAARSPISNTNGASIAEEYLVSTASAKRPPARIAHQTDFCSRAVQTVKAMAQAIMVNAGASNVAKFPRKIT